MKNYEFDLAIIGGGCIGSAIFKELAALGLGQVCLIDNGRKTQSATASSAGMQRVFHENLEHVELALANQHLISNFFKTSPPPNGSLYFFHKERFPQYEAIFRKMDEMGYPFEVLNASQGRERFSEFQWGEEEWAVYEPLGTHYDPKIVCDRLLDQGIGHGAQILESFEVQRICPYQERYRICGPEGTVTTKSVILAGGARLLPRLPELGFSIPLQKQTIRSFELEKSDDDFVLPNFFDRETLAFGRLGKASTVVFSDPQQKRVKVQKWKEQFKENVSEDCYAPNRAGIMGQIPGRSGLFLATGWGGTAFKFSLEIGKRVSRIVERDIVERRN